MRGNYRNKKLLEVVRESPCQHCGVEDGTVVAAHSNWSEDGKGMGIKSSDAAIAALCYNCHVILDQGASLDKQARKDMWNYAHKKTMRFLIENGYLIVNS